ncbi:MAG: acylphosphatase [Gammaproteobacteria bacterium]
MDQKTMAKSCIRCYVSGMVQGVFFRASTKEQADQLEITGYAKNLTDGRVEVLACGESKQLDKLYQWLHRGPSRARVTHVTRETHDVIDAQDFVIL